MLPKEGPFNNFQGSKSQQPLEKNKGCVTVWPCHLHFKVSCLKAKQELWKLKYFTMQKYNLQKKSFKRNQPILHSSIVTSIFCPIGHEIRLLNIILIVLTTLHMTNPILDLLMGQQIIANQDLEIKPHCHQIICQSQTGQSNKSFSILAEH